MQTEKYSIEYVDSAASQCYSLEETKWDPTNTHTNPGHHPTTKVSNTQNLLKWGICPCL